MTTELPATEDRQAIADRLEALRREAVTELAAKSRATKRETDQQPPITHRSRAARSKWLVVLTAIGIVLLPFFVLIRGAIWLYDGTHMSGWLALLGAAISTGAVLAWYGSRLSRRLTGKRRYKAVLTRFALPLVGVYCAYTLIHFSSVNVKSERVRKYYTEVHPLLRVALSTATLFDGDLVVTDMAREPADYARMGLPVYENSLHFRQDDGYVHAVDLRTLRRAEWRNWVMRAYFAGMGFRTLRHVGTADHLHVSLPTR